MSKAVLGLVWALGLLLSAAESRGGGQPLWTSLPPTNAPSADSRGVDRFADLIERARPAVVTVYTAQRGASSGQADEALPLDPWRLFPRRPGPEGVDGIGSGFLLRADGLVLTNHHVIADAAKCWVHVVGIDRRLPAKVLGSDARSDLALLKVRAPRPLPVLPLGDSDRLRVGAWVVAIGNPFGLALVATKGIVSGKGRTLGDLPQHRLRFFDFIQTDAAIDRGNSGGPLLNLRGEVVGINTAINSRARGIGFAVPVNLAKAVLGHLVRHGRLVRSYLGITIDDVDWELAHSFGLDRARGVVVTQVREDTPAEGAGLRRGDIILRFSEATVESRADLGWRTATWPAGTPVKVVVWRQGVEQVLEVVPTVRSSDRKPEPDSDREQPAKEAPATRLGLQVVDLHPKLARSASLPAGTTGVVVVGTQGQAAAHGIRPGDVITEVNGQDIRSVERLKRTIEQIEVGGMIRFYVLRQRGALYIALRKNWKP